MDQKPPPYAPPYASQPGDPSGSYPYSANAPYPTNPASNPYPPSAPYPVGQPGFPQPQPVMNHPQGYAMPPPQHTTVIVQGPAAGTCPTCRVSCLSLINRRLMTGAVINLVRCIGLACMILVEWGFQSRNKALLVI